jgi:hypothetical protein
MWVFDGGSKERIKAKERTVIKGRRAKYENTYE